MAKRSFNGSPTVDGYYTTFDSSEVHRIEEPSDEGGGGGSSDFSTATVTINCTSGTLTFPAGTPHIVNDELVVDSFSITPNNDVVLTMPLYKNKLVIPQPLFPTVSDVPTTTGAITLDFGTGIVIQGDGTISAAGI